MQRIDVDYFLELDLPFFEPENQRRGGWSGVSVVECAGRRYFIKRQKNHTYREARRLYRRTPTLRREYRNILRLRRLGMGTPDIIFYGEKGPDGVLVTSALEGHVDLVAWLEATNDIETRQRFFERLTSLLLRIHAAGFHHGCLYGRHIMIDHANPENIAFLDLEKLRRTLRPGHNAAKDIGQLFRHQKGMTETEKQFIVDAYKRRYRGFEPLLEQQLTKGTEY